MLAVKPAFAKRYHLRTIADLAKVPRTVRVSGAPEFRTRVEGFVGLRKIHGLRNLRFHPQRIGTQYAALDKGTVDAADVFTTDGQLRSSSSYVVLKDLRTCSASRTRPRSCGRRCSTWRGPAFADTLNAVSAKLTTQVMRAMNASVVLQGQSPASVAHDFLSANDLK